MCQTSWTTNIAGSAFIPNGCAEPDERRDNSGSLKNHTEDQALKAKWPTQETTDAEQPPATPSKVAVFWTSSTLPPVSGVASSERRLLSGKMAQGVTILGVRSEGSTVKVGTVQGGRPGPGNE